MIYGTIRVFEDENDNILDNFCFYIFNPFVNNLTEIKTYIQHMKDTHNIEISNELDCEFETTNFTDEHKAIIEEILQDYTINYVG